MFQISGVKKEPLTLPEAEGEIITLTEKVYVPVKEHPDVSIFFFFSKLNFLNKYKKLSGEKKKFQFISFLFGVIIIIIPLMNFSTNFLFILFPTTRDVETRKV